MRCGTWEGSAPTPAVLSTTATSMQRARARVGRCVPPAPAPRPRERSASRGRGSFARHYGVPVQRERRFERGQCQLVHPKGAQERVRTQACNRRHDRDESGLGPPNCFSPLMTTSDAPAAIPRAPSPPAQAVTSSEVSRPLPRSCKTGSRGLGRDRRALRRSLPRQSPRPRSCCDALDDHRDSVAGAEA